MDSIAILFRKGPYGSVFVIEGIRIATAMTAYDLETHAIFCDDAVFALLKNQDTTQLGMPSLEPAVKNLPRFDVKMYCVKEAMEERMIHEDDLLDIDGLKVASHAEISEILERVDTAITV